MNSVDIGRANQLYARYVRALEPEHMGEYAAVSFDGRVLVQSTLLDAVEQAESVLGPDSIVFKVGERSVGKWLSLATR